MIRLGCCLPSGNFVTNADPSIPVNEAENFVAKCRYIIDLGFDFCECNAYGLATMPDEDFQYLLNEHAKQPLKIDAANCLFSGAFSLSNPGDQWESILAYAHKVIDRLVALDIRYVVFGSGGARKIPDSLDREEGIQNLYKLMKAFADYAEPKGLTMVLEPLRSQESNVFNLVDDCAKHVRNVNHKGVRLLADTFHMLIENSEPEVVLDCEDILRHCHIADGSDRRAPGFSDLSDPSYHKRFADALHKIHYSYGVSIECGFQDFKAEAPVSLKILQSIFNP